jgi:hypothetical protein
MGLIGAPVVKVACFSSRFTFIGCDQELVVLASAQDEPAPARYSG